MLLAIDIGNTNVALGIFRGKKLILTFKIPTPLINNKKKLEAELAKNIENKKIKGKTGFLKEAIICSVVPHATRVYKDILQKKFCLKVLETGHDLKAPIKNLYSSAESVGQDRLVNAVAAVSLYGKPAVVVDFGTCVTFDCISKKGEYLGGLILPGIEMTLTALHKKTALLPQVKMSYPKALIGRTTQDSIRSGVYHSLLGACEFIIKELKKKLGKRVLVIGTGSYIKLFSSKIKLINISNLNLTLFGLYLIYSERRRK